jgi:hypothetical protein
MKICKYKETGTHLSPICFFLLLKGATQRKEALAKMKQNTKPLLRKNTLFSATTNKLLSQTNLETKNLINGLILTG